MLVRKCNSAWKPSENIGLQVGETIEITDAKALIMNKMCVAVDAKGNELDAFDLYGEVDQDLVAELKAYKEAKLEETRNATLEAEKAALEKEIAELKKANPKKYKAVELDAMSWPELRKEAKDAGIKNYTKLDKEGIKAALLAK